MENTKNGEKLLLAILMLLVENREVISKKMSDGKLRNIEILLAEAGFKGPEIAKIINKNLAAVQKTIQRGRKQK